MKHYGYQNPEGSEITNLTVPKGSSFPSNPDEGELFYRDDLNQLNVYDGSQWVVVDASQTTFTNFTASNNQTVFTVNYEPGAVDVYVEGIKLQNGTDYTATNGTSITLTPPFTGAFGDVDEGLFTRPYDIGIHVPDSVSDGDNIATFVASRPFTITGGGHEGYVADAPSGGNAVFTVQKNGSSIGTITFNTSSNTLSSETVVETDFVAGDRLDIVATTANSIANGGLTLSAYSRDNAPVDGLVGGEWVQVVSYGVTSVGALDTLADVSSSTPSDKDILQYNSTASEWQPVTDNYAFRATKNVAQNNIAAFPTITTISFSNEDFDEGAVYDGTDTFTAPVDGIYHFSATVVFASVPAGQIAEISIEVNSTSIDLERQVNGTGSPTFLVPNGGITLKLNANDTVAIGALTTGSGVDLTSGDQSWFAGHLVKAL